MTKRDAALLDAIETIRAKNNTAWMDLVRLALEAHPPRARRLLRTIATHDGEIRRLTRALAKGRA